MKKLLLIITTGFCLVSCSKNMTKPSSGGAANQNVFYRDSDISIENMAGSSSDNKTVTISFTTGFEKNICRIELMSSSDASTFCTTQFSDVSGNSSSKKNYSFSDTKTTGSMMYYLLRFKTNDGNWNYSPYLTVKVY